jgi:hypothetical protein
MWKEWLSRFHRMDPIQAPRTSEAVGAEPTPPELPVGEAMATCNDPAVASVAPVSPASTIADIVQVEEVASAEFYAGDLFRRRFGGDPPDYPRHFVAFYRASRGIYQSAGYLHYSPFEDSYLCGGLVIDERIYRQMPGEHRKLIKTYGGIAEYLLRQTFPRLSDAPAIWGYVGNKQAEAVDLRVGFVHTAHKHIMVVWNREISDEEKQARLEKIMKIGPF